MEGNKIPWWNRLYAKATYEYLSTFLCEKALLARFIIGDNPVQWYLAKTAASEIKWKHADGNLQHGFDPRPVSFETAFVLATDTSSLQEQQDKVGGAPAVAFRVGQAAIAGFLQLDSVTSDGLTQVGLRVGSTGRDATIGLFDESTRLFIPSVAETRLILENVRVDDFADRFTFPLK